MMTLSLVHRSSDTVNKELLTPESTISPTNGSHRLVSSIYSSVPSILTSVMLSCGDEFGSISDIVDTIDVICVCGTFCCVEIGVSSIISPEPITKISHDQVLVTHVLTSLSSDLVSTSMIDHSYNTHDHVSDIISCSSDRERPVDKRIPESLIIGSDSNHGHVSDILLSSSCSHSTSFTMISSIRSSSHDHEEFRHGS